MLCLQEKEQRDLRGQESGSSESQCHDEVQKRRGDPSNSNPHSQLRGRAEKNGGQTGGGGQGRGVGGVRGA